MLKLGEQTYGEEEIEELVKLLRSGERLTMHKHVKDFEEIFAKYIGSKYALMVNSGSSANLLAVAAVCNPMRKNRLCPGDKVYVPSICWSTSVFPLLQYNLTPVFLDVNFDNLNIELDNINFEDVKAIMCVHVLGNSTKMSELMTICKEKNIIVIEDTCESLGSTYKNIKLGNFGDFGTFSFYFSHHITTIEGGMIVCNNEDDYELLKCLRSHGWSREQKNINTSEEVDKRFCFINLGYNLRPMEIQGLMGKIQLKKLEEMSKLRKDNRRSIIKSIKEHPYNKDIVACHNESPNCDPNWFSIPLYIKKECNMEDFFNYLTENGIENRPIISGNFCRQPVLKLLEIDVKKENFPIAEKINNKSFYIGCPTYYQFDSQKIADIVLNYWAPISFYKEPYKIENSLEYIKDCLDRTWVSYKGKYNKLCEEEIKKITETNYVLLTNSGTSAIQCMVKCAKKFYPDIKNIYAPNNVYIAIWNILMNEYPVDNLNCLDVDEKTLNIENLDKIKKNSILFVVHNISAITNIPKIKRLRPDIIIFEDASEGYLGKYENKMVGSEGLISTLSFNMNKHFTSGGGGAFCTNNRDFYDFIKSYAYQGLTNEKFKYNLIGNNFLMPDINASLLYSQIKQVDIIMDLRKKIFETYKKETEGLYEIQQTTVNTTLSYWFVCLKLKGLKNFKIIEKFFKERNIELRPMFYGLQEFKHFPKTIFPVNSNSKIINMENFIVPCYPSITDREIKRVIECLKIFIQEEFPNH